MGPSEVVDGPVGFAETWLRLSAGMLWVGFGSSLFLIALLFCLPSRATRIKIGNVYGSFVGRGCAWLTGSRFVIRGEEHAVAARPTLYVCNHSSILDVFLGVWMSRIGTCGVAKREIVYYPFLGQFYWLSGHLLIDRKNNSRGVAALEGLVDFVKRHGLSVYIWPEGTRSRDGRLLPFKRGPFHLALATRLPMVPIVLRGSHRAWPNRTLRLFRTTVEIEFLPPIDTSAWSRETLDRHIADIHDIYARALPDDQRPRETATLGGAAKLETEAPEARPVGAAHGQ